MNNLSEIGSRIRAAREARGLRTLDQFADRIRDSGCRRPSVAKLSRIETGEQPIATDILPIVAELTGIAPADLRPDLAELLRGNQ
jgi:transcriptional regulator with XRE-family HTH domain